MGPRTVAPWLSLVLALLGPGAAPAATTPTVTTPTATTPVSALALSAVLGARSPSSRAFPGIDGANPDTRDRERTALWGWPLLGRPEIVRQFDPPAQRWLRGHRGIDLDGLEGEPVLAVAAGTVTFSGTIAGVGVVAVTHPDGLRSTYQPVLGRLPRGTRVARGDTLGLLDGVGAHCPGCLHLGAVRGRDGYVDPTPLLLGVELSLLPLGP